jgi:class 3 adenylate cyclase
MYSACYFGYLFLVYLFFYIYQYINYIKNFKGGPRESTRVALVAYLIYFFLCSFFTLLNNYIRINAEVSAFNNIHLGAKNTAKIKEFVDRLLPKHVRESLDSSEVVAETLENVTLLFADIVGFTEYSSTRAPTEVVEMLSNLFTSFDKECNKLNLYKVYTIGDCYVVMSFLDKNNRISPDRECINVVELAFKMIEIIARVRKEVKFDGLHMRIGIHTGRIIGGLMGTGIVRYDLYGRDVLIANKMESSGQHDAVHISKATKDMLEKSSIKKFTYREDEPVDINALHIKVDTYFIENEKNAN